ERSRPKAPVPPRRRQTLRKRAEIRPPARSPRAGFEPRRAGDSLWLAHGFGGAGQSGAADPKAVPDRKRRKAAGGREYRHPRSPRNRPPESDRPAARPPPPAPGGF